MASRTIYLDDDGAVVGMDLATAWQHIGEQVLSVRRAATAVRVVVEVTEHGVMECQITAVARHEYRDVRVVGTVSVAGVQQEGGVGDG